MLPKLPDRSIDCIITSPPYGQLKDYGSNGQLGFGQSSPQEYLEDLATILGELHRISKKGAAFWMVLDTVRTRGSTLLLPWEVIERADRAGWRFEDLIIWDKGRSLPWTHLGRFRGVFEYVLLFSKGGLGRFEMKGVREIDHLSPYWLRYPERYNPGGKAPSDLWHFPIPVQGSWSRNGVRHFCPFPLGMVARMITLTTTKRQIVLDPFAGTGSVLAVASHLGRRAVGIDLNSSFARSFKTTGFRSLIQSCRTEIGGDVNGTGHDFASLIVRLRALKAPRTLFSGLSRPDRMGSKARQVVAAFIMTAKLEPASAPKLARVFIWVLIRSGVPTATIQRTITQVLRVPPLSKFGIAIDVRIIAEPAWRTSYLLTRMGKSRWFVYTSGNSHSYDLVVNRGELSGLVPFITDSDSSRYPPIFANLKVKADSLLPE